MKKFMTNLKKAKAKAFTLVEMMDSKILSIFSI